MLTQATFNKTKLQGTLEEFQGTLYCRGTVVGHP